MDTSPWETTATKSGGEDEEWTAFESADAGNGNGSGGWADFSNLNDAPTLDGGPRMSSPDALSDKLDSNTGVVVSNSEQTPEGASHPSSDSSLNESSEQSPISNDERTPVDTSQSGDTTVGTSADTPAGVCATSANSSAVDVSIADTKGNNAVSMEVVSSAPNLRLI